MQTGSKKRSKQGNLEKFSAKRLTSFFKPGWEIYYFQLVGGSYLQYFHKGTTTKPHKQLYMSELFSIESKDDFEGRKYCFELVISSRTGSKETWVLAAKTNEDRVAWMEAIKPGSSADMPSAKETMVSPTKREPPTQPSYSPTLQPVPQSNSSSLRPNSPSRRPNSPSSRPHSLPHPPQRGPSHMTSSVATRQADIPPPYQQQNPYPHSEMLDRQPIIERSPSPRYSAPPGMLENGSGNMLSGYQFQHSNNNFGTEIAPESIRPSPLKKDESEVGMGTQTGSGTVQNQSPLYGVDRSSNLLPPQPDDLHETSSGYEMMQSLNESDIQDQRLHLIRERTSSEPVKSTAIGRTPLQASGEYHVPKPAAVKTRSTDCSDSVGPFPLLETSHDGTTMPSECPVPKPRKNLRSHSNTELESKPSPVDAVVGEGGKHFYHVVDRSLSTDSPGSKPGVSINSLFPFMEREPEVIGPLNLLTTEDLEEFRSKFESALLPYKDVRINEEIGEGAFGIVYKGIIMKPDCEEHVAIKTIRNCNSKTELMNFLKESALMNGFNHPNVLGLSGLCLDCPRNEPLIILPFMANGDLKGYLRNKRGDSPSVDVLPEGLCEQTLLEFCLQIALGMEYLEERHFVHRDLAARNCMVDEDLKVKVADFGMARDIHSAEYYKLTHRQKLPLKWMAPESIFDGKFSSKSDVWAFGITCWEVYSLGRSPYSGMNPPDLLPFIDNGKRLGKPKLCPESIYSSVLLLCWDKSPSKRPSFQSLVSSIQVILSSSNSVYVNF